MPEQKTTPSETETPPEDAQVKPAEHRISAAKIAEFKKRYLIMRLVEFEVKDDDGNVVEIWEALFHKPAPLEARNFFDAGAKEQLYDATRQLALSTVVFPARSELQRLIDENPDLPLDLSIELKGFVQRIGKVSGKNV